LHGRLLRLTSSSSSKKQNCEHTRAAQIEHR
jgi:hypothetical protein